MEVNSGDKDMTITISIPFLILAVIAVILGVWTMTRSDTPSYLGSDRSWAMVFSIFIFVIAFIIVGGIWWW
jgi:hypothetical protein